MCSLFSFPLLLIFSIFFDQNPLFSFEMEILTSQKGEPQLALDGVLYVIDKKDKKIYVLYWSLINVRYLKLSKNGLLS